jgi:23S rRNA (adenine2503-C2)-methyltransferase
MGEESLVDFFSSLGEPKFRAKQVMKWIHVRGVIDFSQMTDLSKRLREHLAVVAEVRLPGIINRSDSKDGTVKWLIEITENNCVEAVYIPEKGRGTLCISSQIGCSLDCSFCSTGKQGFNRDLDAAEIIAQLWIAVRELSEQSKFPGDRTVTNVVLMGMGEPLLNFTNVVEAINLMMHDCAYGLSKRRVTLSTAGVVPALEKLADVTDVSLAISLHAPNDQLRNQLVPLNKKYPIATLLESACRYLDKQPDRRRKITIEYTLIAGINDQREHAEELAKLLSDTPCKINLIPFNPFPGSEYQRPSNNAVSRFREILHKAGYTATLRTTRGEDISAACGQLAGEVNDRTRRAQRYGDIKAQNIQIAELS